MDIKITKILSGFTFLTLYVSMRAPPLLPLDLDVIDIRILYKKQHSYYRFHGQYQSKSVDASGKFSKPHFSASSNSLRAFLRLFPTATRCSSA